MNANTQDYIGTNKSRFYRCAPTDKLLNLKVGIEDPDFGHGEI